MSFTFRQLADAVKRKVSVPRAASWFDYEYDDAGRHACPMCHTQSSSRKTLALFDDGQRWWCFHCAAGGDVIDWLAAALDCSRGSALNILVARTGVDPESLSVSAYLRSMPSRTEALGAVARGNAERRRVNRCYHKWKYRTTMMEPGEFIKWVAAWDDIDRRAADGKGVNPEALVEMREPPQLARLRSHGILLYAWNTMNEYGLDPALDRMINERRWTLFARPCRMQWLKTKDEVFLSAVQQAGIDRKCGLDGRAVFCIRDVGGRVVGLAGRATQKQVDAGAPKYINTRDTNVFKKSRCLYLIERAAKHIVEFGYAVVVEGYADALALHTHGMPNTVASMGARLTRDQALLLSRLAPLVVVLLDGDDAGRKGAVAALEACAQVGARAEVVRLPVDTDPDEMCAAGGVQLDRLRRSIGRAVERATAGVGASGAVGPTVAGLRARMAGNGS